MQVTPSLSLSDAINVSTSKVFQFQGRSRRSEFWWTKLLVCIVSLILTPIIGGLLDLLTIPLTFRRLHDTGRSGWWWGVGALMKLTFIIFFGYDCIMAMVNAGRMNGYGEQEAISFIMKYGMFSIGIGLYQIYLLVLYCLDGDQFENDYGESPKYIDDTDVDV